MMQDNAVRDAGNLYSARNWATAYDLLSVTSHLAKLDARDIQRLGDAAYLIAKEE